MSESINADETSIDVTDCLDATDETVEEIKLLTNKLVENGKSTLDQFNDKKVELNPLQLKEIIQLALDPYLKEFGQIYNARNLEEIISGVFCAVTCKGCKEYHQSDNGKKCSRCFDNYCDSCWSDVKFSNTLCGICFLHDKQYCIDNLI